MIRCKRAAARWFASPSPHAATGRLPHPPSR